MINRINTTWGLNKEFLHNRMSFICGPRQIGKTTTVREFLRKIGQEKNYHNWDSIGVKRKFAKNKLFFTENLPPKSKEKSWVVFDEIHKYPKWKNLLKGFFDEFKDEIQFAVTGSARLDLFRKSGDSLLGRYFLYKMFPLCPKDLIKKKYDYSLQWDPTQDLNEIPTANKEFSGITSELISMSGFPEPFLKGSKDFYQRWQENYLSLLIHEDIRDLTNIAHIKKLETLVFLLPDRIGAPLSLNSLTHLLECSYGSVKTWLEAFEKVFLLFCISPYTSKISRSILKEKKYYFWDWGLLENKGQRFENFVAVQLLRAVTSWNEWGKGKYELFYARTKEKQEVDFVITKNKKPAFLVEAKLSDTEPNNGFKNIRAKLSNPPAFQVVHKDGHYKRTSSGIITIGIDRFLQLLP